MKVQFLKSTLNFYKVEKMPVMLISAGYPQDLGQCLAHIGHSQNMVIGYVTYPNIYWFKNPFQVSKTSETLDYS